jgi:hypothetical protein
MKLRFVVVVLAVLTAACGRGQDPIAPTIININNTNTNNINMGPGGVGDTGPSSGPVLSCTINMFGEPLRKDGSGACSRSEKQIAIGCEQAITLNPRDADGNVIFNEQVTGVTPEVFGLAPGSDASVAIIRTGSDSAYNRFVQGVHSGILTFNGQVKGKSCSAAFSVVP